MPPRENLIPPGNSPKPYSLYASPSSIPPEESGHHSRPQRQPMFKAKGIWWLRLYFLPRGDKLCNPPDASAHGAHRNPGPQGTTLPHLKAEAEGESHEPATQ